MLKPQLLETIKIINGQPQFLEFHQRRFDFSRHSLLQLSDSIHLAELLHNAPTTGVYRCRVVYSDQIESIEYFPEVPRHFQRFCLMIADDIRYDYKFLQRDCLTELWKLRGDAEDILIVKHGLITDTSIANVAFFDGEQWLTPESPLLFGTTRARLLEQQQLKMAQIKVSDLSKFSKLALLNAMLGFYIVENFIITDYESYD